MIVLWGIVLGLPILAYGLVGALSPRLAKRAGDRLRTSRKVAIALTVVAWFWTAWELDNIGIDVFDTFTKFFPFELWILAAGLSYLTIIWMPNNLPTRAMTAILMLFPASLFRVTRLLVPSEGFAAVHILVVFAYIAAIIGMYGMFYPWRLEKLFERVFTAREPFVRGVFALVASVGFALIIAGFAAA